MSHVNDRVTTEVSEIFNGYFEKLHIDFIEWMSERLADRKINLEELLELLKIAAQLTTAHIEYLKA